MVDSASQTIIHNERVARLGPMQCCAMRVLINSYPGEISHRDLCGQLLRSDGGPSRTQVSTMLSAVRPKLQMIGLDLRRVHGGRGGSKVALVEM